EKTSAIASESVSNPPGFRPNWHTLLAPTTATPAHFLLSCLRFSLRQVPRGSCIQLCLTLCYCNRQAICQAIGTKDCYMRDVLELLDISETAGFLLLKESTIRAWILKRSISFVRLKRRLFVRRFHSEQLIDANVMPAESWRV